MPASSRSLLKWSSAIASVCILALVAITSSGGGDPSEASGGSQADVPGGEDRRSGITEGVVSLGQGAAPARVVSLEEPEAAARQAALSMSMREHMRATSPDLLESFEALVKETGLSLDAEAGIYPWDMVRESAQEKFSSSEADIERWEKDLLRGLPADGRATPEYLRSLYSEDSPVPNLDSEELLAACQDVINRHAPRLREIASEYAIERAAAKAQVWEEGLYTVTPRVGVRPAIPPGARLINASSVAHAGWCLSYVITDQAFPVLGDLRTRSREETAKMVSALSLELTH